MKRRDVVDLIFAPTAATFTASQGAKYDGVRTFAQEMSHVTTANYYFASKILGEKMPVDPKSIQSLTTKEELLKAAADSFAWEGLSSRASERRYGGHGFCRRRRVDRSGKDR